MADKELFGISEPLNCSDCVNHGGDWNCDHVQCRKGADTISRQAALKGLESLNVASFYEDNEHSKEAYHEIKQMLETLPTVDAVPVTWIEGEIKWLKEMDNPFATMSAGQIEAMLKRWKDGDHHEG